MMNSRSRTILKAIRFERPEYIPMNFSINASCWHHYPQEALFELMENHPLLFPEYSRPQSPYKPEYSLVAHKDEPYADDFRCVWETTDNGITGTVTRHPLADWTAFDEWQAPDPSVCMGIGPIDWERERRNLRARAASGGFVAAGLRHGHTFLQLCDLRGYQNLLFDMIDEDPRLWKLMEAVEAFNAEIVKRYLDIGVHLMSYPEDLGMQVGPMISPKLFKKYIKPSYRRLIAPAREKGVAVQMHSDGDIRTLADDLVDSGVEVINLQDLVNGVDWIAGRYRGKLCVELDIDRQSLTRFGTPEQIDALIREEVEKISTPQGGMMMVYGLYPGVPLENIKALMDAMERYAFYHG